MPFVLYRLGRGPSPCLPIVKRADIGFLRRGLKVSHLRLFAALAETAQISAAAGRLAMSQPAASRLAAETARITGSKLYERTSRGIELTACRPCICATRPAHAVRNRRKRARTKEIGEGSAGHVNIGAVTGPCDRICPAGGATGASQHATNIGQYRGRKQRRPRRCTAPGQSRLLYRPFSGNPRQAMFSDAFDRPRTDRPDRATWPSAVAHAAPYPASGWRNSTGSCRSNWCCCATRSRLADGHGNPACRKSAEYFLVHADGHHHHADQRDCAAGKGGSRLFRIRVRRNQSCSSSCPPALIW